VTIHVTSQAPSVTNDVYGTLYETQLVVAAPGVLGNDSDPDTSDTLSIDSTCTLPANGSLTLDPDGGFTYTPDTGFTGNDSFSYAAKDQTGTSSAGCATVDLIVQGPTAVGVTRASATRTAHGTLVRWRTGTDAGIAGFQVFRERAGRRVRASKLIAATGGARGHAYSWLDRSTPSRSYWLRVIRTRGAAAWVGPIS
jgi:hypothetical protein